MPLGIPAPTFGISERAGAVTGTLASSGSVTVPAGAVLSVTGTHGTQIINCDGTAASPAFIQGAPGHRIEAEWGVTGSYCIFENLVFAPNAVPDYAGKISIGGSHVALRNSDLYGYPRQVNFGIGVFGGASDVVIYKNKSHDHGDANADFDQDSHGAVVGPDATRVWFLENEFYGNSGNALQINGGPNGTSRIRFVYVGRNVAHNNKQTGFWTKQASDVIFSENVAYANGQGNSAGLGGQYAPNRVWYLYNQIHDSTFGIRIASNSASNESNIYLIGNVAWNIHAFGGFNANTGWSEACFTIIGGTNRYIVNNTCYDADSGVRSPSSSPLTIAGNIFARINSAGHHIYNEAGAPMSARNNLTDVGARERGVSSCSGCIVGNPAFTNASAGDFTLQPSSPAVDHGADESVYATFMSLYGIDIRRDAGGAPRPQGRGWDIGAYER